MMQKDARLEELSEKISKGELVDFFEAIEVINYQNLKQEEQKQNTLYARFVRWICT